MLLKRCDICGKKLLFTDSLTCQTCGKEVCSGHPSEQYKEFSSIGIGKYSTTSSFNYPDGKSFNKDEFVCYNCRTGRLPQEKSKPRSIFLSTKRGMIILVIIMLLLSAGLWYSYSFFTRDIYFETEGYSGEMTTDTFKVKDEGEIKLIKYSPSSNDPSLTVKIYESSTDKLISKLSLRIESSGKAGRSYSLKGDDIIPSGEYYLVIDNSDGKYKVQVMEEII